MIADVLANRRAWWVEAGDALAVLRTLPAGCVHCCVCSPPYYGLRDYGTGAWQGGDPGCSHRVRPNHSVSRSTLTKGGSTESQGHSQEGYRDVCGRCGARRIDRQIGLEESPAAYVARLVEVFGEVRRVLRDDATLWLNVGDSYAAANGYQQPLSAKGKNFAAVNAGGDNRNYGRKRPDGFKPKDLFGVPWLLAFALRDAGWYLRSAAPWVKRAAMPESVEDRPASALEYVFLLAKKPRYFFDTEAVRRPSAVATLQRDQYTRVTSGKDGPYAVQHDHETPSDPGGRCLRNSDPWFDSVGMLLSGGGEVLGYDVTAQPFKGAHFAVMPRRLVEPMVRAGTSERGACPGCGAPWRRVLDRVPNPSKAANVGEDLTGGAAVTANPQTSKGLHRNSGNAQGPPPVTVGWGPGCACPPAEPVPCLVLDPFAGAGTTLLVARRLGRRALGVDLSPEYCAMSRRRVESDSPLFNTHAEAPADA